jgi:DNA-binding response OmpR family regulator
MRESLESSGYEVREAPNGARAKSEIEAFDPDLVVLDIGLPDIDGLILCSAIRANRDIPIIICSGHTEPREKVLGLRLGADDYLGKPVDLNELEARVEAVLRRRAAAAHREVAPAASPEHFRRGALDVNLRRPDVRLKGEPISLTPTEYRLLVAFARKPDQLITRPDLAREVWGSEDHTTLDVHISHLRTRLAADPATAAGFIAERGRGYRFSPGDAAPARHRAAA